MFKIKYKTFFFRENTCIFFEEVSHLTTTTMTPKPVTGLQDIDLQNTLTDKNTNYVHQL